MAQTFTETKLDVRVRITMERYKDPVGGVLKWSADVEVYSTDAPGRILEHYKCDPRDFLTAAQKVALKDILDTIVTGYATQLSLAES